MPLLSDHVNVLGVWWEGGMNRVHSGSVTLLQTVTVTVVPPGFPLQTHIGFFRFVPFLSLLLPFLSPSGPMSLSSACFLFLVGLFFQDSAKASYASLPFSPLCSLLTCELFQWNIFKFSFISTWLLNLFSCCLYIILILLWFLKFHLYYILGPRDHPDIVDSFMQLQAQVCFWFLISFTLGFSLSFSVFSDFSLFLCLPLPLPLYLYLSFITRL